MSATEVLRRMLDERGVEWTEGIARPELTQVRIDGKVVKFHPWQPNTLKVSLFDITPEQAVAATLGAGTCVNMDGETDAEWFTCSECNTELRVHEPFDAFSIHYCPNCGRKVVDE